MIKNGFSMIEILIILIILSLLLTVAIPYGYNIIIESKAVKVSNLYKTIFRAIEYAIEDIEDISILNNLTLERLKELGYLTSQPENFTLSTNIKREGREIIFNFNLRYIKNDVEISRIHKLGLREITQESDGSLLWSFSLKK
ncbi:MAG: prepilin-type N-terminal cleavage/methylation domain-containing protein [Fervidobacterium sp.]